MPANTLSRSFLQRSSDAIGSTIQGAVLTESRDAESTTSRELVARVIAEAVERGRLEPNPFEFEDGSTPVSEA